MYVNAGQTVEGTRFEESRKLQMDGLVSRRDFIVVSKSHAEVNRLYDSRFVNSIINEGKLEALEKYHLVVQALGDKNHEDLNHAPKVQRASLRLLISCRASNPSL